MEKGQIDQLLAMHSTKLPFESLSIVKKKLENIEYETAAIYMSQLKDPTISLIISDLVFVMYEVSNVLSSSSVSNS